MVNMRPLLALGATASAFVILQGGSGGGCGGGAASSTCTKSGISIALNPGDCAAIPSCVDGGYFDSATYSVASGDDTPSYLSVEFRPLSMGLSPVAHLCALTSAPLGQSDSIKITGSKGASPAAETTATVRIRQPSSMDVALSVPDAPVVNGRTLVSASKDYRVEATARVGSFDGRVGDWSLVDKTSPFSASGPSLGTGTIATPATHGLTYLELKLKSPLTMVVDDDVFTLPVRVMSDGDAAANIVQLPSTYRAPCPGFSEIPSNCVANILCFSREGTIAHWPIGSTEPRNIGYDVDPEPSLPGIIDSKDGYLQICEEYGANSVSVVVKTADGATVLDSASIGLHR